MAINKPIIDAGPTYSREDVETVVCKITNTDPVNNAARIIVLDGKLQALSQIPLNEGQLLIYQNGTELTVTMYVAISISGALHWKQVVSVGEIVNNHTGQKWDPLARFYNPLAS